MQTGSITETEEDMSSNLVSDVGSGIANISVHLAHDADVLVAVEQGVLLVSDRAHSASSVRSLVGFEAGVG
jgi:16S rRNA A1518/A1519 N6-dimethyltransferase RsmA/KsgA/DIM1 with predicted DNA glycosylase/AP lyase activity